MAIVCFDIGGSFIKGAVARAADDIVPLPPRPTPLDDFEAGGSRRSVDEYPRGHGSSASSGR